MDDCHHKLENNPVVHSNGVPCTCRHGKALSHGRYENEAHGLRHTGPYSNKGCVTPWPCHFTLKSIVRQKENYGDSNISPCKTIIFKKSSKRNQNPSRYYYNSMITNLEFNTSQNMIFKKSSYKNRPIIT